MVRGWLTAVLLVSAWMVAPVDAGTPANAEVEIGSNYFSPDSVSINKGETVRWRTVGGVHDVTAGTPSNPGEEWCARAGSGSECTRQFDVAGAFAYYCTIHPGAMRAEVIVLGDPPEVAFTSPAEGSTLSGLATFTGTASGDPGVSAVDIRVDGGPWQSVDGLDAWTFELDTNSLSNGPHLVDARVTALDTQTSTTTIEIVAANEEIIDFAVTHFAGTTDAFGQPRLTVTLTNDGTFQADARTQFEYFHEGRWHYIASFTVGLAGGETHTQSYRWTDIGYVGSFQVRVVVDPFQAVAETNEGNNMAESQAAFFTNSIDGIDAGLN